MEPYDVAVLSRNPLVFYQIGIVSSLEGVFASKSEWMGLLLCNSAVKWSSGGGTVTYSWRIKTHPEIFKSTKCGNFVLMSVEGDLCEKDDF